MAQGAELREEAKRPSQTKAEDAGAAAWQLCGSPQGMSWHCCALSAVGQRKVLAFCAGAVPSGDEAELVEGLYRGALLNGPEVKVLAERMFGHESAEGVPGEPGVAPSQLCFRWAGRNSLHGVRAIGFLGGLGCVAGADCRGVRRSGRALLRSGLGCLRGGGLRVSSRVAMGRW